MLTDLTTFLHIQFPDETTNSGLGRSQIIMLLELVQLIGIEMDESVISSISDGILGDCNVINEIFLTFLCNINYS